MVHGEVRGELSNDLEEAQIAGSDGAQMGGGPGRGRSGTVHQHGSKLFSRFVGVRDCGSASANWGRRHEWPYFSKWMDVLFDHLCLRTL
jgi:hypothetical protein